MTERLHPLLRQVGLAVPPGLENAEVTTVSCDSRRVGTGTLFVGLPGTQVDGGQFWPEALAAGAVLAVIATVRAALTVRQQRLLLDQARQTLPAGSDQLRQLEQRFAASTGLSSD